MMFSFSPFAIVTLFILLFLIIKNGFSVVLIVNLIIFNLLLEIAKPRGYFLQIGNGEYYCEDAISVISLFITIIFIFKNKISLAIFRLLSLALFIAVCGLLLEIIFPLEEKILNPSIPGGWDAYVAGNAQKSYVQINYVRFALFVCQLLYFFSVCSIVIKYVDSRVFEYICKKIVFFSRFILLAAFIDFLFKYFLDSKLFYDSLSLLLGEGLNTYKFDDLRNGELLLQGITREPSHFAYSLFCISIFFYIQGKVEKRKSEIFFILLSFFLMWLSGAFSSVLYSTCFILFGLIYGKLSENSKNIHVYSLIFTFLILCFVIVLFAISSTNSDNEILSRINNIRTAFLFIIEDDWRGRFAIASEYVRFISIIDTVRDFVNKPLFGIGAGVELAHSGVITFLTNFGILGMLVWWLSLIKISSNKRGSNILLLLLVILPNFLIGFYSTLLSVFPIVISNVYLLNKNNN